MRWWAAAATAARSRAVARSSPRQQAHQPYQHHHFHHRGLLSSGGACSNSIRRNRYALMVSDGGCWAVWGWSLVHHCLYCHCSFHLWHADADPFHQCLHGKHVADLTVCSTAKYVKQAAL